MVVYVEPLIALIVILKAAFKGTPILIIKALNPKP